MATTLKDSGTITVTPLHPAIGAEIGGVDLSRVLDEDTIGQIRDACHAHTVLLFRGQEISGEDQLRLAAHFGPIAERHTPKPGASQAESPEWTNLMPVSDKKDADGTPIGARVMQGYDYAANARLDLDIDLDNIFHYCQPMIVTNPGSGRKALYISRLNTMWIEGMARAESEAILAQLFDLTEDPAIIYEHVWRPGDVLLWDNLACLHARTDWPENETRMLRRCTTLGEPLG